LHSRKYKQTDIFIGTGKMGNKSSSMLQDEEINLISEETGFSKAQIERLYERFKSLDKSGICGSLSRQDFLRVPELAINPLCDRIVHMFFVDCDEDHDRINFRQFMKVLATFRSSTKPTRSRQASRQESIQNILTSLSQNKFRHSRHSSCDGFFNYYPVQHHTTNQHSIHYVASTTHLAQYPISSHNNIINHVNSSNSAPWHHASNTGSSGGLFKKPYAVTNHHQYTAKSNLLDPDEPANSRKQKLYFMFKIYDVDDDNRISLEDLKQILMTMVGNYISNSKLTEMAVKTMKQADRNGDGFIDFDEFCTAFLHRDIDELLRVKFTN
jgi:Ca2+-binding EF-hand superfamily protein